jgi:hypothetical protein
MHGPPPKTNSRYHPQDEESEQEVDLVSRRVIERRAESILGFLDDEVAELRDAFPSEENAEISRWLAWYLAEKPGARWCAGRGGGFESVSHSPDPRFSMGIAKKNGKSAGAGRLTSNAR